MPTLDIQTGLQSVFIENPGKAIIARVVREMLWKKLGHTIPESEFQREFIHFRDTFQYEGKRVLHVINNSVHRYILTDNRYHIGNHNTVLKKEINRRQRRIIAI